MVKAAVLALLAQGILAKQSWNFTTCGTWPSEPVFVDSASSVLAVTSGKCLHLVNASSGEELWRHKGNDYKTSVPTVDNERGIAFYGHELAQGNKERFRMMAVSLASRRPVWDRKFRGFPTRPVLSSSGDSLVFGDELDRSDADSGFVYSVNATTGDTIWSVSVLGAVRMPPVLGRSVYVTDRTGTLSALSPVDGSRLWAVQSADLLLSSPVEHPEAALVFVGAHRFRVFALNSTTGESVWNFTTRNFMSSTPVLTQDGKELHFVSNDGHAYALNAYTGQLLWRTALCVDCEWPPNSIPIISNDGTRVILGGGEKLLFVLDRATGKELWHAKLPSVSYGRALESADGAKFFVSSGSGLLSAWDSEGVDATSTTCPTDNTWPPTTMSDNSHCENVGLSDLSPYRYGLPLPGAELGASTSDPSGFLPYFSSHPLNGDANPDITTAVIWIHGLLGNANKFFCDGIASAESSNARSSTLTLTPWFGDVKQDTSVWNVTGPTPLGQVSTCWKTSSWLKGGNSYPSASNGQSSFTLVDALVDAVRSSTAFPNLQKITLVGFSAGCQLLSRWSFFSPVALDTTTIVGDCGTYMYLDETRPDASCSALSDTGVEHTCTTFSAPTSECDTYNDYKYGINVSTVANNNYVEAYAADATALEVAIANFSKKQVYFLEGNGDVCQCNYPGMSNAASCFPGKGITCAPTEYSGCCDTYPDSTESNVCSSTCEAMLTGSNRLQRGLNYAAYLQDFYAKRGVDYTVNMQFFDGAHDNTAFGLSPHFSAWAGWTTGPEMVSYV